MKTHAQMEKIYSDLADTLLWPGRYAVAQEVQLSLDIPVENLRGLWEE